MKFFNYILIVVAFNTTSMHAKVTGGGSPEPMIPQPQPTSTPARPFTPSQQPVGQIPTFPNLIAYVKTAHNSWDRAQKKLSNNFVNDIIEQGRKAQLSGAQLEVLLKTARDMHGIFSHNQQENIAILQSVEQQIATALQRF